MIFSVQINIQNIILKQHLVSWIRALIVQGKTLHPLA